MTYTRGEADQHDLQVGHATPFFGCLRRPKSEMHAAALGELAAVAFFFFTPQRGRALFGVGVSRCKSILRANARVLICKSCYKALARRVRHAKLGLAALRPEMLAGDAPSEAR